MGTFQNHSVFVTDQVDSHVSDFSQHSKSDLWIGLVLILMILSCLGCVCSCLLYHKLQQWKLHGSSLERNGEDIESPRRPSSESLPSYTLVTGLPSYEQAVERSKISTLPNLFILPIPDIPPPPFVPSNEKFCLPEKC